MRVWTGVLTLAALGAVLSPGVARANLAVDVFRASFNEPAAPPHARFLSDPSSEALLHDYAFTVVISAPPAFSLASVSLPVLKSEVFAAPQFETPRIPDATVPDVAIAPQEPTVEYYQAAAPRSTDPPAYLRFGRLGVSPYLQASQTQASTFNVNESAIGAGAIVNARVGKRAVGLDFSSSLAHYASTDPTSNVGLSNDMVPVSLPAFSDISKQTLSAGVAVPVSARMTASLQVDAQHLIGNTIPFDAYNTIYGLGLTYKMKGPGAISLVTKQYRYQDNLLPLNFVQTSTNLTFSVKF